MAKRHWYTGLRGTSPAVGRTGQLIGYSVSGYGSLDYVTKRSRNTADRRAQKIRTSMKVREK